MRKTTRYARKRAHAPSRIDPAAVARVIDYVRPFDAGDMLAAHNHVRVAFERLRTGCGEIAHFDLLAEAINANAIRAESIDADLLQVMKTAQSAVARLRARYLTHGKFGFDAEGLQAIPPALDVGEAITDASSPLQMINAIKEMHHRLNVVNTFTGESA